MNAWETIVSAALVGTGRTKSPKFSGEVAEALAGYAPDEESVLLAAAGSLDLWNRAGIVPRLTKIDELPAEPETKMEVSAQAATYLALALGNRDESLVVEWMELCARAGKIAAPQLLPQLLDFSVKHPAHTGLVSDVGGTRATWLAAKNRAWVSARIAPDWESWETSAGKDRIAQFASLRNSDPARARDAAAAAWQTEPANIRAALLSGLKNGLSMADEPFLESALDDRSKEVRAAAADTLARLAESRLVARMTALADTLVTFGQNGPLCEPSAGINPPAAITPEMNRDGADVKVYIGSKKLGEKALALLHIVASVPPSHWSQKFDLPPAAILKTLEKTEWADAAIIGIAWAAARFADGDFAAALFEHKIYVRALPFPLRELGAVMAESKRAAVLESMIQSRQGAASDVIIELTELLDCFDRFWPPGLANAVLAKLRKAASGGYHYHLANAMRACLARIPLEMAGAATLDWPDEGEWRNTLAPLLDRLQVRAAMSEAIFH